MKKIVLITSGQPSTNPRLVKEADALASRAYQVTVVYQYWDEWAEKADQILFENKKWEAICVGGNLNKKKWLYLLTRLSHKIFRLLQVYFGNRFYLAEMAGCRNTYLLYLAALNQKADLYIGHNLGALAPAVWAAKKKNKYCGFDAEDFHRNERSSNPNEVDVKFKTYLEDKYFPFLSYLTTASPLINKEYEKLFPECKPVNIDNVFKKYLLNPSQDYNIIKPLKLFWFSQKIGPDRGIEDVFKALKIIEDEEIEFHILGKPRPNIIKEFDICIESLKFNKPPNIVYHSPMDGASLMNFAAIFDIGLCLEPGFSRNNEIALSNKLFTYINVGLALICTETDAQHKFVKENPEVGRTYPFGDVLALAKIIKHFKNNPSELNKTKTAAFNLAQQKYNWELESQKLFQIIDPLLK